MAKVTIVINKDMERQRHFGLADLDGCKSDSYLFVMVWDLLAAI